MHDLRWTAADVCQIGFMGRCQRQRLWVIATRQCCARVPSKTSPVNAPSRRMRRWLGYMYVFQFSSWDTPHCCCFDVGLSITGYALHQAAGGKCHIRQTNTEPKSIKRELVFYKWRVHLRGRPWWDCYSPTMRMSDRNVFFPGRDNPLPHKENKKHLWYPCLTSLYVRTFSQTLAAQVSPTRSHCYSSAHLKLNANYKS